MERLPIKFEEEVLEKHGIIWDDEEMTKFACEMAFGLRYGETKPHYVRAKGEWRGVSQGRVSKYELVGIAIEAMKDIKSASYSLCIPSFINGDEYSIEEELFAYTPFTDKDFCECIFKAVRKIWG